MNCLVMQIIAIKPPNWSIQVIWSKLLNTIPSFLWGFLNSFNFLLPCFASFRFISFSFRSEFYCFSSMRKYNFFFTSVQPLWWAHMLQTHANVCLLDPVKMWIISSFSGLLFIKPNLAIWKCRWRNSGKNVIPLAEWFRYSPFQSVI